MIPQGSSGAHTANSFMEGFRSSVFGVELDIGAEVNWVRPRTNISWYNQGDRGTAEFHHISSAILDTQRGCGLVILGANCSKHPLSSFDFCAPVNNPFDGNPFYPPKLFGGYNASSDVAAKEYPEKVKTEVIRSWRDLDGTMPLAGKYVETEVRFHKFNTPGPPAHSSCVAAMAKLKFAYVDRCVDNVCPSTTARYMNFQHTGWLGLKTCQDHKNRTGKGGHSFVRQLRKRGLINREAIALYLPPTTSQYDYVGWIRNGSVTFGGWGVAASKAAEHSQTAFVRMDDAVDPNGWVFGGKLSVATKGDSGHQSINLNVTVSTAAQTSSARGAALAWIADKVNVQSDCSNYESLPDLWLDIDVETDSGGKFSSLNTDPGTGPDSSFRIVIPPAQYASRRSQWRQPAICRLFLGDSGVETIDGISLAAAALGPLHKLHLYFDYGPVGKSGPRRIGFLPMQE